MCANGHEYPHQALSRKTGVGRYAVQDRLQRRGYPPRRLLGSRESVEQQGFAQNDMIFDLSGILGKAMGTFGTYLFLVIAIAALFSTILANVDGGIRMWTDLIHKGFPSTQKWSAGSMYIPLMLTLWTIGFTSFVILEISGVSVLSFFFINAAINGCAMAIYVLLLLDQVLDSHMHDLLEL